MTQQRKTIKPRPGKITTREEALAPSGGPRLEPEAFVSDDARPLSARSVIASTLLGMPTPRLPVRLLVRSGELFAISEGTTRVALSRMVSAGELRVQDGNYRLSGRLLERHQRQTASRVARHREWIGDWQLAVVTLEGRDVAARAALRDAMRRLKLIELREGVWTRPDNLPAERSPDAQIVVSKQCQCFVGRPVSERDDVELARQLWDLEGWAREARHLRARLRAELKPIDAGDTAALAPAFVLSAAVLRHLLADPELPDNLVPRHWPGNALRDDYNRYDQAFKALWRAWFREQA